MKRIRKSLFFLLLSSIVIGSVSMSTVLAQASKDHSSDYSMHEIACEYNDDLGQYVVKAYPPKHITSMSDTEMDVVTWTPVLYHWDGVRFYIWNKFDMPSAFANVTPHGIEDGKHGGWFDTETQVNFDSVTFKSLPSGAFAVMNVMTFESNGEVLRKVSPNTCDIQR